MKNALIKSSSILLLLLTTVSVAFASHFKAGEEINITTPYDGNAYIAAGTINISAPIEGDLICAGGQITVSDTIRDDAWIAGGDIDISGVIVGDLRIGGGSVRINNRVGGDLIVASGNVIIGENAVIAGDLIVTGGDVELKGRVVGNLKASGGNLLFDGIVEGNGELKYGNIELNGVIEGDAVLAANSINLGLNPALYGRVEYWTRGGEMDFGSTLKSNADLVYNPDLANNFNKNNNSGGSRVFSAGFWIWSVLSSLVIMILLYVLFKRFFHKVGRNITDETLNKGVLGFGYFVALPVLVFALFITVIGIPAGIFVLLFYIFTFVFAKSLTAVVGAFALNHYLKQEWTAVVILLVALGLYIVLTAIGMLPFIGTLSVAIATFVAFGAVIWHIRKRKEQELV